MNINDDFRSAYFLLEDLLVITKTTTDIFSTGLYGGWGIGDTFPTPSPESPDHWSTPSPQTPLTQSPHSDWSDRAALSPNDIQQTNKGATEAIYI